MNTVATLISSWLDSLKIFFPSNLKIFLFVALKNTKDSIVSLSSAIWLDILLLIFLFLSLKTNFDWLFIILLISVDLLLSYYHKIKQFLRPNLWFILLIYILLRYNYVTHQLFAFLLLNLVIVYYIFANLIIAARSSVEYKDRAYFLTKENLLSNLLAIISIFIFFTSILPVQNLFLADKIFLSAYFFILFLRSSIFSNTSKSWRWLQIILILLIIAIVLIASNKPYGNLFKFDIFMGASPKYIIARNWFFQFFMAILARVKVWHFFISYFFSPFLIFSALFMLDSQNKTLQYIKSFWRALKMFIFNYPFCFITFYLIKLIILAANYLFNLLFTRIFFESGNIQANIKIVSYQSFSIQLLLILILPFYICIFVNYYIKQIHDKFLLYYKR